MAELEHLDGERIGGEPRDVDRNADREHQQGGDVGEHRRADGHSDRLVPQLAELLHDRERDQRVGGEERPDEQRPDPGVSGPEPDEKSRRERKREREQPEADGSVAGPVELHQVDFHPGEEHQQELAEFGEEFNDLAVLGGELKTERADQHPGSHQPDHGRQPDTTAERRDGEQDQHRDGEPGQWW